MNRNKIRWDYSNWAWFGCFIVAGFATAATQGVL